MRLPRRRAVRRIVTVAAALLGAVALLVPGAAAAAPGVPAAAPGLLARGSLLPECPPTLDCRFVPAAYDWSSADHSDPNSYGNYDPAERPADGTAIRYIVIHDTEGVPGSTVSPYDTAIRTFQDPASQVSAHYVIRSADGQVTQMVRTRDIAYHAGNWTFNQHSIGIEHEGFAAEGGRWYTEAMYRASARLVHYLAARYRIPLDRSHILGHEDIPRAVPGAKFTDQHWDPGPYWDWAHFMDLLGAPIRPTGPSGSLVVTIRPDYTTNQPALTGCGPGGGDCAAHGANAVPLRTEPRADAPLIADPVLRPDGSPGTTRVDDWSDKAVAGRSYALADRQGEWTAIWYGGQLAWFHDAGRVTVPGRGRLVAAKEGAASVPLYGRAFPDRDAYPDTISYDPAWDLTPVPWTLPAGQLYLVVGEFAAQNYYARFDEADVPGNHTRVAGPPRYLMISYNHRYLFVLPDDVHTVRG